MTTETRTRHTPTPWKLSPCLFAAPDGDKMYGVSPDSGSGAIIAYVGDGWPIGEAEANAARIVACVNACAGLNPEAVRELLAACQETVRVCDEEIGPSFRQGALYPVLSAAIAKAKGGQP